MAHAKSTRLPVTQAVGHCRSLQQMWMYSVPGDARLSAVRTEARSTWRPTGSLTRCQSGPGGFEQAGSESESLKG